MSELQGKEKMKLYQLINKLQNCPEIYSNVIVKNKIEKIIEIKEIVFNGDSVEIVIDEEK